MAGPGLGPGLPDSTAQAADRHAAHLPRAAWLSLGSPSLPGKEDGLREEALVPLPCCVTKNKPLEVSEPRPPACPQMR